MLTTFFQNNPLSVKQHEMHLETIMLQFTIYAVLNQHM